MNATHPLQTDTSPCFLCGVASQTVLWRENGYEGIQCHCGMLYTNQAARFRPVDPIRDHHPPRFYSGPATFKATWVARHCPGKKLLEVGCGEGHFLRAARGRGYDVAGLEPNPALAHLARQHDIPVVESFLEESSLQPGSYDVVYHCDLLAHLSEPVMALKKRAQLLTPGGALCFEAGLLGGVSPAWYRLIGTIGLGQHLWLYSDRALKMLLVRAHLEVVEIKYFGLSAQVIGGKILGVALKRVVAPLLRIIADGNAGAASDGIAALQSMLESFLRYRIGSLIPHIGPQTVFVVARPAKNV